MLRYSSKPILRSLWSRYALALLAAVAALWLRVLLAPLLGQSNPYHTVWLGVVFCAWFCGVGPSVVATLIMVLGIKYWFLPPTGSLMVADPRVYFGMAGFLLFAGVIITIGDRARRTQAKLNKAHDEMEETVRVRTAQLARANQKLHELSTSLLHMQDAERRRLARDLHDSVGQLLSVIGMDLSMLREEKISAASAQALQDAEKILQRVIQEIRTLSHLLHPPMLDESGLEPALRIYLDGFTKRSRIETSLEVSDNLRLSQDLEIAIFRIVQEALTNAHKHAAAETVRVSVKRQDGGVTVQVSDNGKGMPEDPRLGVGLTGMQERVRELTGTFEVQSSAQGTTVTATLPVTAEARPQAGAASPR